MRRTPRPTGLALAAALLAGGCSESASPRPSPPPRPVRLADLLDRARIDSPLTEIRAVGSITELRPLARETVLEEGFDGFDPDAAGWTPAPEISVDDAGGGHALRVRGLPAEGTRRWLVPADPVTPWVFRRSVRAEGPPWLDLAVVELKPAPGGGEPGPPVRVHWPQADGPNDGWRQGLVSFVTRSKTRWLAVEPRARPGTLGAGDRSERGPVWFDDVRLERVEPTPRQEIALMKAGDLAPGADPELGIEKRGQFPPLDEPGAMHSAEHDDYTHRYALYAPAPTELGFELDVPDGATLRFAVCLARQTRPGVRARFTVLARTADGTRRLWSREVAATDDEWHWHHASADLSALGGSRVGLVLRTTAEVPGAHAVWGNPVVDVPPGDGVLRNVVLIAVDTLRADRLSCYGFDAPTSPNIDALAADGVRFENVASNSTWTNPSFASIFTGVVPSRHGVFSAAGSRLPPLLPTLAERFRAHGWATQSIVYKAPLYYGGYDRGFDAAFNVPDVVPLADNNLAEAMAWLERSADRCNFLFLHFDDPHQPFNQPEPYDRLFGEAPGDLGLTGGPTPELLALAEKVFGEPPDGGREPAAADVERVREAVRGLYAGEVAYVDDRIGAFLDALKRRGLYDEALILFVSDHGEELWDHGRFGHGDDRLHDEVVRVPLIVKPPAGTHARGTVVETQVRGFDAMPTLLELAGLPVEEDLDAESLVPLLAPGAADIGDRLAVTEIAGAFGLRTRGWKYVLRSVPRMWTPTRPPEALYDLRADPGETVDVGDRHADVRDEMRLRTLDYLLAHRPGRYLVGVTSEPGTPWECELGNVANAFSFWGLPAELAGGGRVLFRGRPSGRLVMVASLVKEGPVRLEGSEHPATFVPYRPGDLRRLVREPVAGIHAFEGPPERTVPLDDVARRDLELMESLRALGYAGGVPNGAVGTVPR